MQKIQPPFTKTERAGTVVSAAVLQRLADSWLLAGDINRHSERTLAARRALVDKLLWFLAARRLAACDTHALRQFLHYVSHGHKEAGGRWGNARMTRPTTPGTVKTYHRILRALFNWLVAEGEIQRSPMERVTPPLDRPDQIQPFTDEQLHALLSAAKRSRNPRRDEAILLLLLDTGLRASELCALTCQDADLHAGQITVREGKGGKKRVVPFSRETKRALYNTLNERQSEPGEPLFLSDRGHEAGNGLTRHGLRFLIGRLGKAAGMDGAQVRCSPHTLRHSFAIGFLRAGGNVFTLKTMLGHESLHMTNRYVALAQADVTRQHSQFSPVTRLKGGKGL